MAARNWLPSPSPLDAPRTNPAMSRKPILVGTTDFGFSIAAMASSRGSGTATSPVLGSMVEKGKFAACAVAVRVRALNTVDLPTLGRPMMPQRNPIGLAQPRPNNFLSPRANGPSGFSAGAGLDVAGSPFAAGSAAFSVAT